MIIVETSDALLVCRRDRAQRVKEVLEILKKRGEDHLL
jgi:mannose-1-phosphate guanylyltransferase